jgi:hypothetical protein
MSLICPGINVASAAAEQSIHGEVERLCRRLADELLGAVSSVR